MAMNDNREVTYEITEEIGATYAAIEQDASHIDRFDSIEMSFKYMRDVLGMPTK